jgi:DNA-binding HxlR family transcriptional regulator
MEQKNNCQQLNTECGKFLLPVRDTLDIINGKWRIPIIIALCFKKHRFKEIQREITGITPRMLSKELKDLEVNGLVERVVLDTYPETVEYHITEYGKSLKKVIEVLYIWGEEHRSYVMN